MDTYRILFLILSVVIATQSIFAQPSDESAKRFHVLPLVVDGDGFQSSLLVTNVSDSANQCALNLQGPGLDSGRFEANDNVSWSGSDATVDFADSGAQLSITSTASQSLASGYATLDCVEPVVARTLYVASAAGAVAGMTTIPSAQVAAEFRIPVLSRFGELALILLNHESPDAACRVELNGGLDTVLDEGSVPVPANSTAMHFLGDVVQAPTDLSGGSVTVSCDQQIAATGLMVNGAVMAALPPAVLSADTGEPESPMSGMYGVDDMLPGVPGSGFFHPAVLSGGSVSSTADGTTIELNEGGYFELTDGTRYTCTSPGGCTVVNGTVTAGVISVVQSVSGAVTIPDDNLRAAVEAALGKASGEPITRADMESLTRLSANEAGISELAGLEYAANLTELHLGWNNISDLRPLADLTKLEWLGLRSNSTSNVSFLASLTNLEHLNLENNRATDISSFSGLTSLRELYLGWNNISDPSPLADLTKLERLDLQSNNTSNLSFLVNLTNLVELGLGFNGITDISPLTNLTNLTELWMYGNRISDLSPLSDLTSLTTLIVWSNSITEISPLMGLVNLTWLELSSNPITNLSPLQGLANVKNLGLFGIEITNLSTLASWLPGWTNLERLNLGATGISDISLLAGLTNLTRLHLGNNNISDLSPLSGLTKLTELWLFGNVVADVIPLAGLNSLTNLRLGNNDIMDVSALGSLVRLSSLDLEFNRVADISALVGLAGLTRLNLRGNSLSDSSINIHIPALQDSGASVLFDSFSKGDYDIELIFSDRFTDSQKNVLQYVARRWMAVIVEDLPDYEFTEDWSGSCGDQSYEIPTGERIDDLRIYMGTFEGGNAVGYGGPSLLREGTHLPVLGCMSFDLARANLLITGLHEIGHVLGFGSIWNELGFLQDRDGDTHFNGPLAIAAFDEAGGSEYTGAKVPLEMNNWSHWRSSALPDELMGPVGGSALSAITVQSFADLGYGVDVTQADAYTLPEASSATQASTTATTFVSNPGNVSLREGLDIAEPEMFRGFDFEAEPIRVID